MAVTPDQVALYQSLATMITHATGTISELSAENEQLKGEIALAQTPWTHTPDLRPIGGFRCTSDDKDKASGPARLWNNWTERGTPWLLEQLDKVLADGMERIMIWTPGGNPGGMISASQYHTMPLSEAQFDSFTLDVRMWLDDRRKTTPGLTLGIYMGNSGRDYLSLGASGVLNPFSESDRRTLLNTIVPFVQAGFTEFVLDTGGSSPWFVVEWNRIARATWTDVSIGGEALPFDHEFGILWPYLNQAAWWILDSHKKVHKALAHDYSGLNAEVHWMPHAARHEGKTYEQTTQFFAWLVEKGWIPDGFSPDSRALALEAFANRESITIPSTQGATR